MIDPRLWPMLIALGCAGCGPAPDGAPAPPAAHASPPPAQLSLGDVEASASVLPTTALNTAMAGRYGVAPATGSALLVVSLQAGGVSRPATVSGQVRDLRGVGQALAFREVAADGTLEYIAVIGVRPPDTLRFDLVVDAGDGQRGSLKFSRDLLP